MHIKHERVIDCSGMTPTECSDLCLVALGHGLGFKLRADVPDDVVNGSVTIVHNDPPIPHEIYVEIYDQDNLPKARLVHGRMEGRRSTLKRPVVMPTEQEIKERLNQR